MLDMHINFTGGRTVIPSASDDLESLLYIFIEIISTYPMPGTPPDHHRQLVPWQESAVLGDWPLATACKQAFLWSPKAESSAFMKRYLMVYFQVESFEEVVLQWRLLFKLRDQEGEVNHQVTHEKVRMVLEHGLKNTQDEHLPLPPSLLTSAQSASLPSTSSPQSVAPHLTTGEVLSTYGPHNPYTLKMGDFNFKL